MNNEKMNVREKISIWALLLIIKIVKPTNYSHEWAKELEELKKHLLDVEL